MYQITNALIIEDNYDDFELYSRILTQKNKVKIVHFTSAEEALLKIEQKQQTINFDLVLLDYNLQGVNGVKFLKKLRQKNVYIDSPVIVLTGQGNENIAIDFMHLNVADYLKKDGLNSAILQESIIKVRYNYEMQKKEQEKQEELLRFAHTLAHALKSPIARIKAYCALARKNTQKCEQYIINMQDDAMFLMEFIDKLLIYAEGNYVLEKQQNIDLGEIIQKSIRNLEVPINNRHATIKIGGELPKICGHEMALVRLFQNLISNSIKYSSEQPIICIKAKVKEGKVIIYVQDNGIGIPKESVKKIFQPFYRVQRDSIVEGTGLGLSIVKSIIDQHDASIKVLIPKSGAGTIFKITFSQQ
jgi:signal transduction histidine kinase